MERQPVAEYGAVQQGGGYYGVPHAIPLLSDHSGKEGKQQPQGSSYQGMSSIAPAAQPYPFAGAPAAPAATGVDPAALAAAMQLLRAQGVSFAQPQQQEQPALKLPDGSIYVGDTLHEKPHGTGTLTFPLSDQYGRLKYQGDFQNGERHGHGILMWRDGRECVGGWARNKMQGKGKETYPTSAKVISDEGDYVDGALHGYGVRLFRLTQEDIQQPIYLRGVERYEGAWVKGKADGQGKMTFFSGSYNEGIFKDDSIFTGVHFDKAFGRITSRYVNGQTVSSCCTIL